MKPTLDDLIAHYEFQAHTSLAVDGIEDDYASAVAEALKRLKAIDEGRGEWVDTGERE